jgi:hypothetical protein
MTPGRTLKQSLFNPSLSLPLWRNCPFRSPPPSLSGSRLSPPAGMRTTRSTPGTRRRSSELSVESPTRTLTNPRHPRQQQLRLRLSRSHETRSISTARLPPTSLLCRASTPACDGSQPHLPRHSLLLVHLAFPRRLHRPHYLRRPPHPRRLRKLRIRRSRRDLRAMAR